MAYKAFQDFYHDEAIKHLVLHNHNGILVSPPFATEKCRDYSKVMYIQDQDIAFIDLDLPPATSKFNAVVSIEDSVWFIPYGIYDNFNVVVQLKNGSPIYHNIDKPGKGQFYSVATDGKTAFGFPLGYKDTGYGIYIKDEKIQIIDFNKQGHTKLHMGTVYCNGSYWSAPRGDTSGYCDLVKFDGSKITRYEIKVKNPHITRKYTDIIVYGNKLFCMPYGEEPGINEVIEFDTFTETYVLHELDIPDFAKKFNTSVLVDDTIISLPYGDEMSNDSNWGLLFDVNTKEHRVFDIGLDFGGKYRFRSGINYQDKAMFLPTGTPSCPILLIDKKGNISSKEYTNDFLIGRPIKHNNMIKTMAYSFKDKESYVMSLDSFLR